MGLGLTVDHHAALDLLVFRALNRDGGPRLDWLALALSRPALGIAVGLLLAAALWWWTRRGVRAAAALGLSVLVSDRVGAAVLRPALDRMRPCYALASDQVRWLGTAADVGSLPSLHASNLFALAMVAALADRRLAPLAYLAAVAVSLSRVYLGVHWPTDVLAGAAWGSLAGLLAWWAARPLERAGRPRPGGPRDPAEG